MKTNASMWAMFCDDVRQEVGNKLSFIGIYGPNLVVPALPTTLLKLCCVMVVRAPAEAPPKSVTLRILQDDEELHRMEIDVATVQRAQAATADLATGDKSLQFHVIAQFANLAISERCRIRARALVDGEELKGGSLVVMAAALDS